MNSARPDPSPYEGYPAYPTPAAEAPAPVPSARESWAAAPQALRPVLILLAANLALSLILTVVTIVARHSVVDYQLDHRHITDPTQRAVVRDSYTYGIVARAVGNIVVSVVYAFLVRALLRGRRWAYRRVLWLGGAGIVALVVLQATPYPIWMRIEQLLQAAVLAALLYFVLRPQVKAHFDPNLPGRTARRFQR